MVNIDEGFDEIVRSIEEKRTELKTEFDRKFEQQINRIQLIRQDVAAVKLSLDSILSALLRSDQFLKQNPPEKILQKYHQVQELLRTSYTDLDGYLEAASRMRSAIFVKPEMRPVKVNVARALRAVYKIELFAANSEGLTLTSSTKPAESTPPRNWSRKAIHYDALEAQTKIDISSLEARPPEELVIKNPFASEAEDQSETGSHGIYGSQILPQRDLRKKRSHQGMRGAAPPDIRFLRTPQARLGQKLPNIFANRYSHPTKKLSSSASTSQLQKLGAGAIRIQETKQTYALGISEADFMLKFSFDTIQWQRIAYETNSGYDGALKHFGVCVIPRKKVMLIGGALANTMEPTSHCLESYINYPGSFQQKRPMDVPRYAHQAKYLNGYVYAIGGFSTLSGIQENALDTIAINMCEKYRVSENKWEQIQSMTSARAFHSACAFADQFFYVFGGISTARETHLPFTLNAIEKYNCVIDTWNTLLLKLPRPLSLIGCVAVDRAAILLAGGAIAEDEEQGERSVYRFDVSSSKISAMADMQVSRKFRGELYTWKRGIFAVGGDKQGTVERFDLIREEWRLVGSNGVNNLEDLWTVEGMQDQILDQGIQNEGWNFVFI